MKIIIDVDEEYSSKSAATYLKAINIDDELITSITFSKT